MLEAMLAGDGPAVALAVAISGRRLLSETKYSVTARVESRAGRASGNTKWP